MIKHTTWTAMVATVALAAGGGLSGCGPSVPSNPTWDADVHPLLMARCIRCHDSPTRGDPLSGPIRAPFNLNFATAGEAAALKSMLPGAIRGAKPYLRRMPPPPAEALADWETQIIDNWSKEPTPL